MAKLGSVGSVIALTVQSFCPLLTKATTRSAAAPEPTVNGVCGEGSGERDEGIEFYRLLLRSGVPAQCREVKGTPHGAELLAIASPDISYATAASIAHWATH